MLPTFVAPESRLVLVAVVGPSARVAVEAAGSVVPVRTIASRRTRPAPPVPPALAAMLDVPPPPPLAVTRFDPRVSVFAASQVAPPAPPPPPPVSRVPAAP